MRGPGGWTFFALVFALSLPFWVIGAMSAGRLLPGLPVSALAFVTPVTAAAILAYGAGGRDGVLRLLVRAGDAGRIGSKVWYLPALLTMPGAIALTYAVMRVAGVRLPSPRFDGIAAASLFAVFLVAALAEELGWSGYALDPLRERHGALGAAIVIGLVWSVWHLVPIVQAGRAADWIAGWIVATVAQRVLMVWLYVNAGRSVFAVALFHASSNLSWQLFPEGGSGYDPRFSGPVLAVAAVVVTVLWGPRTLARFRVPWSAP